LVIAVAKPANVLTITIPAGQSLSAAGDLTAGALALLIGPPDWTAANISFQVSLDNVTFVDLFDGSGEEVLRTVPANSGTLMATNLTQAAMYIKIRSGSRDAPVLQAADRVFTVALV
jgi:hypothetical protein